MNMSKIVNILVTDITPAIRETIQELRNIRSKNIKIWIPMNVLASDKQYNQSALTPLEKNVNPDKNRTCYSWDISNTKTLPTEELYLYWIQRYDETQEWVIFTEKDSPKQTMSLFLDAIHIPELPNKWFRYKCFHEREKLVAFCKEVGALDFALCEGLQFSVANEFGLIKGAKVYKEKATGYLWYIDTLHKDHIEVFNSTGKIHIGEADISTGIIDKSKSVPGRRI